MRSAQFVVYAGIGMLWLVTTGAAQAQEYRTNAPLETPPPLILKDLTPPELQNGHGSPGGSPANGHGEICPPVSHGDGGFSGVAEYLLMRPRRGLFDFAIRDPNQNLVPEGSLRSLNYELRSGIRAGISYRVPESEWDFQVAYTYFRSNASTTEYAPAGGTLYATLTRPGLNDEVLTATASGKLAYNVYDAVIGRRFALDERASLRAFAGLAWATINQDFNANYDGLDANRGRVATQSNFNGFGPLVGLEGQFAVTEHWHLYARGVGGLLTGTVKNPIAETNNDGLTTYVNLSYDTRKVVPLASLALAGGWHSGRVTARAGYEITNWFGLIDQPRLTGELSEGKVVTRPADLSLEGLFVHVGLSF